MVNPKKKEDAESKTIIWPFGKKNYVLFAVAIAVITLGYVFLGYGDSPDNQVSLTLAPIVLVAGYALIPFAIMVKGRADESDS